MFNFYKHYLQNKTEYNTFVSLLLVTNQFIYHLGEETEANNII